MSFARALGNWAMIGNEVQYRGTKGHLERFEQAVTNLEARLAGKGASKLLQIEFDTVRSQAADPSAEIAEYDQVRKSSRPRGYRADK